MEVIMKKLVSIIVLSIVCVAILIGPLSNQAAAKSKTYVLKMVQVFPKGQANMFIVPKFVERVNKRSKGELKIKLLGGPEAIPTFDQWDALRSGVIDMNFNVTAYYYRKAVPESMITWLSKVPNPAGERKTGFYDLMNELHKEVGVYYLGRGQWSSFYLWPNKKVGNPRDLSGLKMRSGLIYDAFLKGLGAIPVTIPFPEIYTALERGLVDGFCWPMEGVSPYGWLEVTKYCIDHPFYAGDMLFLANLKSFNKLPKHLQKVLIEVTKEIELELLDLYKDIVAKEREKAIKAGVKFIKFKPEDAKSYVNLAWEAGYKEAKTICRPQHFEKLMKMCGW